MIIIITIIVNTLYIKSIACFRFAVVNIESTISHSSSLQQLDAQSYISLLLRRMIWYLKWSLREVTNTPFNHYVKEVTTTPLTTTL